ncbi:hypothetical protein [Microbacterium sp.]|uniref:hypothetical protein n=1 Tax=Microbacterium sp. TaxID=51671 RepID=UPI002E309A9D|nr:hypothetical protein [Microbacterium sp.]HEX5731010.1 hypothetical protein [Microbacterium sp.]
MTRLPNFLGASVVLAATMLAATACATTSGGSSDGATSPTPAPTSPSPTPLETTSDEPAAEPACDTIIPVQTAEDFADVGWTSRAEPFRAGEIEIPEGIQCIWGDFSTATDHVQIFGWAPISDADAADAQEHLLEVGWHKENTPDGVIVTESSETTVATDAEGYGLTYLFGDGWVKYADTKQGLLLVVWPPA